MFKKTNLQRFAATDAIDRTGAEALISEQVANEIIQGVAEQSTVLRMGKKLPNMSKKKYRMPVLDMLPVAYWVNGDNGFKQTSKMAWKNKYIVAEELAVIIPIPEAVLDDADYDIWGEVKPRAIEALGKKIDGAVLFNTEKPDSWRDGIVTGATAAGNIVTLGAEDSLYDKIMGEEGVIAKVEDAIMKTVNMYATVYLDEKGIKRAGKSKEVSPEEKLAALEKKVKSLSSKKMMLYSDYKDDKLTREEYVKRSKAMVEQIDELHQEIEQFKSEMPTEDNSAGKFETQLENIINMESFDREKIQKVIKKVIINGEDNIEIVWNTDDPFFK